MAWVFARANAGELLSVGTPRGAELLRMLVSWSLPGPTRERV